MKIGKKSKRLLVKNLAHEAGCAVQDWNVLLNSQIDLYKRDESHNKIHRELKKAC